MDEVKVLADTLQAQGPDEFPRGYYEYLARCQIKERRAEQAAQYKYIPYWTKPEWAVRVDWNSWTFGFWTANWRRQKAFGLEFGPVVVTRTRKRKFRREHVVPD